MRKDHGGSHLGRFMASDVDEVGRLWRSRIIAVLSQTFLSTQEQHRGGD